MRTTEATAEIRHQLKAHGYTSRDVSVRADQYSLGSTIRVVIRNPAVPKALVEQIAGRFERVRRDDSGEILGGGNRFLQVDYDRDVMAALAAPLLAQISEVIGDERVVDGWRVVRTHEHYYRAVRPGCREIQCWGREFCARQMVEENAARAHKPRVHVTAVCVEVPA